MIEQKVKDAIICSLGRISLASKIKDITLVYGDLSLRRYFRVSLESNSKIPSKSGTIIVMYFDSFDPPEAETGSLKNSFEAYQELTEYFKNHGLSVPEVYLYAYDLNIILLEDLGEKPLIKLARENSPFIEAYYKKAIDYIHEIQAVPVDKDFFPYKRCFDKQVYMQEMSEFIDFFLPEKTSSSLIRQLNDVFERLSVDLECCSKTLVHRDYHSWNLMLDDMNQLRIIDFQDALMGTRSYDLVALVRERDIDSIMGEELVNKLEDYFFSKYSDKDLREIEYPRVLLQRDLKVVGRFSKVVKTRGMMNYGQWIPGTVKRINQTLLKLAKQDKAYKKIHNELQPFFLDEPNKIHCNGIN